MHAVVAQSTFRSQNVQSTSFSDHFWKLRSRKSWRRCVARSTFPSQNVQNTQFSDHFWKFRCRKKCTPLWRVQVKMYKTHQLRTTFGSCDLEKVRVVVWHEAHFQVKMCKTHHSRTTFGSSDVEKVHAVVACPSQNVQNTPAPDHFWKLRYRKSARRCGTKHISKSKCAKHTILGPLLEVQMSKKCTPLWRVQVKMYKTQQLRTTFWELRYRKSARRCGAKHISKSKCTKPIILGLLLEVAMSSCVCSLLC